MVISHNFGIDFESYVEKGKENDFPEFDRCPCCHSYNSLVKHGFYSRNGIFEERVERIIIRRFLCSACKTTLSVLPDFLIPYYQNTLLTVLEHIDEKLEGKKTNGYRQLISFYFKRFMGSLNWIHLFFSHRGDLIFNQGLDKKEKAIKYLKMIRDFGESPFLRRSMGHLSTYFMAS